MSNPENRARAIFLEAIEQAPERWAEFVAVACGEDLELRSHVEQLLRSHERLGSFHEVRPADATLGQSFQERPGTQIGPYKLLQQIGEGGMGTVYMAEQAEPIARRVALKIIKPGMDSRQVIARFEAERQALAMMDHVNIARVLDAGTEEMGRPYFVMELVHGVPITKYCDDNHLTPRERLELFVPVCQAIQHAHQKGIIHRDIKPSNVMVTLYDGKPVPKVIDFGVAKATEQKLTERTLFTQYGTMVGTLEYMSPEQAEMSALGVDTRSDIYSLGVLLYELLTGSTPLTHTRMKEAAYAEILRMIKDEEPPKPSTRLSDSGEALASISANRHTEPAKLTKLVRGELDWIVMKTLEKDRNRRYETAKDFAADVQRYLSDDPVQACPPSAIYQFRKFARRNKTGFAVAGLLLFVSVCLCCGIGWAIRDRAVIRQQAALERNAQELSLANDMHLALKESQGSYRRGKLPEALAELRRADAILASTRGDHEEFKRELEAWRTDLRMADRLESVRLERAASRINDEGHSRETFDWRGADAAYRQAFKDYGLELETMPLDEAAERVRGSAISTALVQALDDWVWSKRQVGLEGSTQLIAVARRSDPEPWRDRVRATFEAQSPAVVVKLAEEKDVLEQPPATLMLLASLLRSQRETSRAIDVLQRAHLQHPADFWVNFMLAELLAQQATPDPQAAIGFYRAALALRPESPGVYIGLGNVFLRQREYARAEAAYRKGIAVRPAEASARASLGWMWMQQGKLTAAEEMLRAAIHSRPGHSTSHAYLASLLSQQERWSEALDAYDRANVESSNYAPSFAGLANLLAICPELSLRNAPRAVVMAQRAVDLDPDSNWNWQMLGWARYRAGEWQASIEALEKSIALQKGPAGGDSFQWFFLAMAHWQLGHQEDAVNWYTKAVDWTEVHAPGNANALAFRAEATSLISPEAILQWYEKAHAGQPDSAETLTKRGAMLARLGKLDAALESFLRAIELARMSNAQPNQIYQTLMQWDSLFQRLAEQQPDNVQLWIERGRFLARRRWTAAAEAYARVTEPSRPVYEYAMVLLLADDRDGYRRLCGKLNETYAQPPPAESAWHLAVVCSAGEGSGVDPARLVSWAEASIQKKRDKFTLHSLSAALYRAGRHEEAIRHAHEGLDLGVSTTTTSFLLALAYHGAGKKAESQTWYDIGLKELEAATPKNPDDPGPWAISHWLNFNLMGREAREVLGAEVAAEKSAAEKSKPGSGGHALWPPCRDEGRVAMEGRLVGRS